MNHSDHSLPRSADLPDNEREAAAGMWLARRDRGLTAQEEQDFAAWLAADLRHREVLEELEESYGLLDGAVGLRPLGVTKPDPDYLVLDSQPASRSRSYWRLLPAVAAAAAVVTVGWFGLRKSVLQPPAIAEQGSVLRHEPRRVDLPDGSQVDLRPGAQMQTTFTPAERVVRLTAGEAHFAVVKNAARPFSVVVDGVVVRAVGTAFSVRREAKQVEVLVAEGRVAVTELEKGNSLLARRPQPDPASSTAADAAHSDDATLLYAGERIVIPLANAKPSPAPVQRLSTDEVEQSLSWRSIWLEFAEMSLADVVNEFNRHNTRKLRVADAATSQLVVSGKFRLDGVDAFVRLIDSGLDVSATTDPAGTLVLKKRP